MSQPFAAVLTPHLDCKLACTVANRLDALCEAIAGMVAMPELGGKPGIDQKELVRLIHDRLGEHISKLEAMHRAFPARKATAEELELARREFNEENVLASIKEIRETGGMTFAQLIEGLEPVRTNE